MYVLPLQEEEDICIQKEDIIFDTCQNSRFTLLSSFINRSIIDMAKSRLSKKAKTTPKKRSKPLVVVADTFTADDAFDLVGCRVLFFFNKPNYVAMTRMISTPLFVPFCC